MPREDDETISVALYLVHATNKAYLFIDEDGEEYWIPKSQVVNIEYGGERSDKRTSG